VGGAGSVLQRLCGRMHVYTHVYGGWCRQGHIELFVSYHLQMPVPELHGLCPCGWGVEGGQGDPSKWRIETI
jgi:hypothetical protein